MKLFNKIIVLIFSIFILLAFKHNSALSYDNAHSTIASDTTHSIAAYFTEATSSPKSPDVEGFLQRWLLLEPINKPNRSNTVFTDSYIRKAFDTLYFPTQSTVVPNDGDKVTVGDQQLTWHALDATNFNVKLFRFAYGLNRRYIASFFGRLQL